MSIEDIALIPKILEQNSILIEQNKAMLERLNKLAEPITTKKAVAKFLNKSESWINTKMSEGILQEGYHFYRKNGRILVFIEDAILEFRNELSRGIANEKVTF